MLFSKIKITCDKVDTTTLRINFYSSLLIGLQKVIVIFLSRVISPAEITVYLKCTNFREDLFSRAKKNCISRGFIFANQWFSKISRGFIFANRGFSNISQRIYIRVTGKIWYQIYVKCAWNE